MKQLGCLTTSIEGVMYSKLIDVHNQHYYSDHSTSLLLSSYMYSVTAACAVSSSYIYSNKNYHCNSIIY